MSELNFKYFKDTKIKFIDGDRGANYPSKSDFYKDGHCIFLDTKNVTEVGFNLDEVLFISKEKDKLLRNGKLQRGDVVITSRGTLGNVAFYGDDIIYEDIRINSGMLIVRSDGEEYLPYYLYIFLRSNIFKWQCDRISSGSAQPQLPVHALKNVLIPKIDLDIQRKIKQCIKCFDDKIELNNQINSKLEAMAKLIYDYWFVQFDFPDENNKPYKSSGGKMIYNKDLKREIPEGWSAGRLSGFESKIITGKTPPTSDENNFGGDIPFICIGDVRGNMYITNTDITLTEVGAASQVNKFIPKGAICVTCIASPGLVAFATSESQTNQQLNSVVCSKEENKYFLYFYLKDYFNFARAKMGNTFANMNKDDFSSILLPYPKNEIVDRFSEKVKSIFDLVLLNSQENDSLLELRNFLLPMLMNGQITIKDEN